jgi:hypothetical protein
LDAWRRGVDDSAPAAANSRTLINRGNFLVAGRHSIAAQPMREKTLAEPVNFKERTDDHGVVIARTQPGETMMDKKLAGLIAAIGVLAPIGAAQAAAPTSKVEQAMQARSFSELLQPIPNAAAVLRAVDEAQADPAAEMQVAQYHHHHHHHYYHHHHHHHHHWWWHHHHHHYHHHHWY